MGRHFDILRISRVFSMSDQGIETGAIAQRTGYSPEYIRKIRRKRIEIINSLSNEERETLESFLRSPTSVGKVC